MRYQRTDGAGRRRVVTLDQTSKPLACPLSEATGHSPLCPLGENHSRWSFVTAHLRLARHILKPHALPEVGTLACPLVSDQAETSCPLTVHPTWSALLRSARRSALVQATWHLARGLIFLAAYLGGESLLATLARSTISSEHNTFVQQILVDIENGSAIGVAILFALHFIKVLTTYFRMI
jgi:hypothetical protein